MFQFRAFPSYAYLIQRTILEYCSSGFPHSEISGSTDICSSPKLIAACHVLRRLLMPRHSPCALYSLTLRDILVLLFGIMQAINRLLSQNCNCYPHLFRCSTIKIHNSFQLPLKPSVALLSSHFNTLFSFQGAISSFFEARSQNPISWVLRSNSKLDLVGPSGLEPPTLRLSVVRSSQLSYGPLFSLVEIVGIEPATSCLQGRRSPS
jgi:hypothetical protein